MESLDRRTFIKRAGVVAAVAGTAALVPLSTAGAAGAPRTPLEETGADLSLDEGILARVGSGGTIQVFFGDREITIVDRAVASRIVRATR